jgi:hypothetical protein
MFSLRSLINGCCRPNQGDLNLSFILYEIRRFCCEYSTGKNLIMNGRVASEEAEMNSV